jgi:hypothetical protein
MLLERCRVLGRLHGDGGGPLACRLQLTAAAQDEEAGAKATLVE